MITETITTIVELVNSRLVDHETFFNSNVTSFMNFATLFMLPPHTYVCGILANLAGAAGLEPAVTALETVGLPVNRRS